jgi:hypothetical protein
VKTKTVNSVCVRSEKKEEECTKSRYISGFQSVLQGTPSRFQQFSGNLN